MIEIEKNWEGIKTQLLVRLEKLGIEIRARMSEQAPSGGQSHLKGSFEYMIQADQSGFRMTTGSVLMYPDYVEFGTKAHWVPFEPLRRWVETKVQPHQIGLEQVYSAERTREGIKQSKRKLKTLRGVNREKMINSVTRAIQYSIAKGSKRNPQGGTKANPYTARALQSLGLPYELLKEPTGWKYNIDVTSWLNREIENLLPRLLR